MMLVKCGPLSCLHLPDHHGHPTGKVIRTNTTSGLSILASTEDIPEAEGLICGTRDDRSAVRGLGKVHHTSSVTGEVSHLRKGRVLPERKLVLGESMRRQDLPVVFRPHKGAHLGTGIDFLEQATRLCIPEAHPSVKSATTRSKQVALPGAPRKSLDGTAVMTDGVSGRNVASIVDIDEIIITSGCKLLSVRRPLQAADLLGVALKDCDGVVTLTDIAVPDGRITATR
mmetsp:Transcript_32241/g.83721  ORF Transcript_32241/g.83721 Transcript_32241/m.83721 type:complete len:228 (-) Transcript_32241:741-1424(-)